MNYYQIYEGQKVRYHPIIGGRHDGKIYTVRYLGHVGRFWCKRPVVWLHEKSGCVSPEALSEAPESAAAP